MPPKAGHGRRQLAKPVLRCARLAGRRRARRATAPRICHSGRASPSGSTAVRKRCTRPSKLVKVPSRSTQAAVGKTRWARALVRFVVGSREHECLAGQPEPPPPRPPATRCRRDRAEDPEVSRCPARAVGEDGGHVAVEADQLGPARVGILVGADEEVVLIPWQRGGHPEADAGQSACAPAGGAARRDPRWPGAGEAITPSVPAPVAEKRRPERRSPRPRSPSWAVPPERRAGWVRRLGSSTKRNP